MSSDEYAWEGAKMLRFLTVVAIFWATTAQASANYSCNENGAVVTLSDGAVYYMGKNCDAARRGGGEGKWWLTASAFAIEIDGEAAFLLPFEVDCASLPACWNEG
ncbi:MAG: hypothetical protein AAGC96_08485 [Pseudomonadota bacterium]